MLNKSIRILNFDDSITKQKNLVSQYQTEIIDFKDLGPNARHWMNNKTGQLIQERLSNTSRSSVTFLGSGDFHHLSHILIGEFQKPICLIVFDSHPDWDILPPRLGCGSWVTRALKTNRILKCILLGISSDDISTWSIQSGNLASLGQSRVEIYPYQHKPTLVFFKRVPENPSIKQEKGLFFSKVYWDELKNKELSEFLLSLLKRMPSKQVYISIDKDCLKKEYALTNWEEGRLSLEELIFMLKIIKENMDIVGMDVAGDYSRVCVAGSIKHIISKIDHPVRVEASRHSVSSIDSLNQQTNLKILKSLGI